MQEMRNDESCEPSAMPNFQDQQQRREISDGDLDRIWRWNASVPVSINGCVHDLISELAQRQPEALAVDAWDGQLSYGQLDDYAGRLAYVLASKGVVESSIVPVYLKKSKWMPIAMLAVIKCGAAAVTLDTNYPATRLQNILDQTSAKIILTSPDLEPQVPGRGRLVVVELSESLLGSTAYLHTNVSPSYLVYISFTSGTTGNPKGACMSHANVCSAVHHQGKQLGFRGSSRVLDFAPYSFDVSWSNFLHTICGGGCICIAREEDMLQDLAAVIAHFRCTLINLTPTMLRTLKPGPTTLEVVLLSGEPPYPENAVTWAARVRLLNTYGPTECTFKSTFSVLEQSNVERPSIGVGVGMCTWLVDADDQFRLTSVGSVGEIYLEGPLVGQGYLANHDLTSTAFIEDPPWLLRGCNGSPGRKGRLYRTGDLARYNESGQLLFVGRRDTSQVKIRGQRVEIADVEHHARLLSAEGLSTVVDVVYPKDDQCPTLTLFVETAGQGPCDLELRLNDLITALQKTLPSFMVPTLCLPMERIPLSPNGKADRAAIRQTASAMTLPQLLQAQSTVLSRPTHSDPSNSLELKVRNIWSAALSMPATSIGMSDNFLRLGGDSIKAIRMAAAARRQELIVLASDILHAPTLRDLTMCVKLAADDTSIPLVEPFSLLHAEVDRDSVCGFAAEALGIQANIIEDILPCTPMQEGLVAMTSMHEDRYILEETYRLPKSIDKHAFRLAWLIVIRAVSLLRTRIVHLPDGNLAQVVLGEDTAEQHLLLDQPKDGQTSSMGLGKSLFRVSLQPGNEDCFFCHVRIHHAIFDGWSRSLILDAVQQAYDQPQEVALKLASYRPFVSYVLDQVQAPQTAEFWMKRLKDLDVVPFPPHRKTRSSIEELHSSMAVQWPKAEVTPSSMIRAALTLLMATYTNSDDVMFGATVSGRQTSLPDIDRIAGPTFAIIPVRAKLDRDETTRGFLLRTQKESVETHEFEQFGLENISKAIGIFDEGDTGLFQLLLVVQQDSKSDRGMFSQTLTSSPGGSETPLASFNSHSMMIVCQPHDSGLEVDISFDEASVTSCECIRFLKQFEHFLHLLCSPEQQSTKVGKLPLANEQDIRQILEWNSAALPTTNASVIDKIRGRVLSCPEALALQDADSALTYKEFWRRSSCIAHLLMKQDIRGCKVLLCLEKSSWMAIATLAVLRAGATAVPMSACATEEKAHRIVEICHPRLCITSRTIHATSAFAGLVSILVIEDLATEQAEGHALPVNEVDPCFKDAAVIVFTSGTTSTSKGIVWNHSTLNSNVNAAINHFDLNENSRILQFAAYDFDVSIVETLSTLAAGGCVCTPSQSDLTDRLLDVINECGINWICLTPSVACILDPKQLSSMNTIVFAGERLKPAISSAWLEAGIKVINWYGPAEASVATCVKVTNSGWEAGLIGTSKYSRSWIVDTHDATQLVPIGAVGELCIEGDVVADGYIGTQETTQHRVMFTMPPALQHVPDSQEMERYSVFRTGDHVKYDTHGNIVFIGRGTNTWTKLHGIRIQLHDLEFAAQNLLKGQCQASVAAEVISLADTAYDVLVLFLCTSGKHVSTLKLDRNCNARILSDLRRGLSQLLPGYMRPTYIIPISHMPVGSTGKVDRRKLQRFGRALSRAQLAPDHQRGMLDTITSPHVEPLRNLWTKVLGVESHNLQPDDHFFRLGGTSISAMRLVSLARQQSLHLTTVQIFEHPSLDDMASIISTDSSPGLDALPPFSLLDTSSVSIGQVTIAAARLCNVSEVEIVNMYPATTMQQGLLALTARTAGQYISRSVLQLQQDIDSSRFEQIWQETVADLPVLRTRIVDLPGQGLFQVVVKSLPLGSGESVDDYLATDQLQQMGLGDALCRAAVISRSFVLTVHHSIYDGAFLSMVLNKVENKYLSRADVQLTPFDHFVRYTLQSSENESKEFWKRQLEKVEESAFPQLPAAAYTPQATRQETVSISLVWPRDGDTPSTILQCTWALVAARFSMTTSVIFGTVLSGRDIDLAGVEHCAGPTNSTVPITLSIDWQNSVDTFLARMRRNNLAAVPHQHYGLSRIASDLNRDELFQTLFVVHPDTDSKGLQSGNSVFEARSYGSTLDSLGTDPFNSHALMISCWLNKQGLRLAISYDDAVLTKTQVQMLARHFERVLREMNGAKDKTLDEVSAIEIDELHSFWNDHTLRDSGAAQNAGIMNDHSDSDNDKNHTRHQPGRHDSATDLHLFATQLPDQGVENVRSPGPLRFQAASIIGVSENCIEDVYPCTPLQESLIVLSERRQGDYVGHDCLRLAPSVDIERFRIAWETVVDRIPVLRTRIIEVPGHGLLQAVLKEPAPWSPATTMLDFLREEAETGSSLGQPLTRYGLVKQENSTSLHFALTMHHSVYDGVSNLLIREALETYYEQQPLPPLIPFSDYIKFTSRRDVETETAFWKSQFGELELEHFPKLPSQAYQPQPDLLVAHSIENLTWRRDDILPSSVIRAAWALVCSKYTNSSDALFGAIVSGRQVSMENVDRVCGPTIGLVPVRIPVKAHLGTGNFLERIQNQALDMIPYEHSGLARIARISALAREACQFHSVLVIQPQQSMNLADGRCFDIPAAENESKTSYHKFNSHALMVICTLGSRSLSIQLSVDSSVVDATLAGLIASQLANVIRQLCQIDPGASLSQISMITTEEIDQIWKWNPAIEANEEPLVHSIISDVAREQPEAVAISAWDGQLTYKQLEQTSNQVARRILEYGLSGSQVIPICFEKSMWATVTLLGIVKAGHVVLMLEPGLPEARLEQILRQIQPSLMITSPRNIDLCSRLCDRVMTVDATSISNVQHAEPLASETVKHTDTLYIIFTSGSTGTPKGCMISHGNMSTSIARLKKRYSLDKTSRLYDFSSYSFDAHHWGMFHTLCAGGTLCVPSDIQKQDQLEDSMRLYNVTDMLCTPATARMINPASVPTMRNLAIGGDRASREDLAPWTAAQVRVLYVYGPSETTAWATSWEVPYPVPEEIQIGKGDAQVTWIVDPQDVCRLAPIGTIGELYLEGPLVGQGYLKNEEATAASFIESPAWLTAGSKGHSGRRGRVYKTGDLVRYEPHHGNIIFVGRRDTQTKHNGRRIELGEIERHVLECLAERTNVPLLAVELVTPEVSKSSR